MLGSHLFRSLRREPGFALAFIITLGLGIGANTAIFSLVSNILLRPLPYPHAERLVTIKQPAPPQGQETVNFSFLEVEDYRQQSETLEEVVEFGDWTFNVLDRGEPHRAVAGLVTANFFDVLGMKPLHGRVLREDEQHKTAAPVVVVTYDYWERALGSDPNVVGQVLNLTSVQPEIVGILEPGAHYASRRDRLDFYGNYANSDHYVSATMQDDRDHRMTAVFARLKEGNSVAEARADLERIAANMHAEYPDAYPQEMGLQTTVTSWRDELVREARPMLIASLVGSFLVLLIACANVANLTMARALGRSRELSVRSALGGTNRRIRIGFFLESLSLAALGAGLGVAIAYLLLDILKAYAANLTTRSAEVTIDVRVLAMTLAIATLCALGMSLLPGLSPSRRLAENLSAGGAKSLGSVGKSRSQRLLVVGQLAVSFLLLFGSIQLGRTLLNLYAVDPGFDMDRVLTVEAPKFGGATGDEIRSFTRDVRTNVSGVAGVESVAMTSAAPLGGTTSFPLKLIRNGGPAGEDVRAQPIVFQTVTADYFKTLGIPMVQGREFDERDQEETLKVAIINQATANIHFGDDDPVGQQIAYDFGGFFGGQSAWHTVVGVAADTLAAGIDEAAPQTLYLVDKQVNAFRGPDTLMVRSATNQPHHMAPQVLDHLRRLDPERPLEHIRTLAEARDESVAPQRVNALLFGSFASLALLIATVGVGAMLMRSVNARRRELAIRAAVGAEPGSLLRRVLVEGTVLVGAGLAIGAVAATFTGEFLSSMLYEVAPTDPLTLFVAGGLLLLIGLVAALLPAGRAMRSNPIELLRAD